MTNKSKSFQLQSNQIQTLFKLIVHVQFKPKVNQIQNQILIISNQIKNQNNLKINQTEIIILKLTQN